MYACMGGCREIWARDDVVCMYVDSDDVSTLMYVCGVCTLILMMMMVFFDVGGF